MDDKNLQYQVQALKEDLRDIKDITDKLSDKLNDAISYVGKLRLEAQKDVSDNAEKIMKNVYSILGEISVINNKMSTINEILSHEKKKKDLEEKEAKKLYITKEEFNPIKSIVYGLITLILISVVVAALSLILKSPPNIHLSP